MRTTRHVTHDQAYVWFVTRFYYDFHVQWYALPCPPTDLALVRSRTPYFIVTRTSICSSHYIWQCTGFSVRLPEWRSYTEVFCGKGELKLERKRRHTCHHVGIKYKLGAWEFCQKGCKTCCLF